MRKNNINNYSLAFTGPLTCAWHGAYSIFHNMMKSAIIIPMLLLNELQVREAK